jgi:autotransporter-associated beta strand protein
VSALSGNASATNFSFNGGTLRASGSFSSSTPMKLGTSGTGATIDTAGFSLTLLGSLSGSGGLTKFGSGTLTVTGSNTYSGPTTINQGSLIVNGSLTSLVTANSGTTLGGSGSLTSATVGAGGRLSPGGSSLGVLQLSGTLALLPGAIMNYQLGTPSSSDEVLMPSGLLSLNGQQFSDFNFSGFLPGTYTLIDAGSISGSLGPNTSGTINGIPATLAVQGDNLVLNVVPEPGTLGLLAVAAIILVKRFQRKP